MLGSCRGLEPTVFFIIVGIIYGFFTAQSRTGIEWAGTTAIVLTAGLS
ncbi:aa3-type cytochrome oxidase subunit IV, partial [Nocardia carnea]